MFRGTSGGLALVFAVVIAACDRGGTEAQKDPGANDEVEERSSTCKRYCDKQHACFPGAAPGADPRKSCRETCELDLKKKRPVARLHEAVAACAREACGEALGACLAKNLVAEKGARLELDPQDLPPSCHLYRACLDARVYGFPRNHEQVRSEIYGENTVLFANLRKASASAEISCEMLVQATDCAGPTLPKPVGAALDVDCDAYCTKQASCHPKNAAASAWRANCLESCQMEAKAGAPAGFFFGVVAGCKDAACGEPLGKCIAAEVDRRGDGAAWVWDMRGLGPSCALVRLCMESVFHGSAAQTIQLTRKASYESYAKVFESLKAANGDLGAHCATMATYQTCE